MKRVLLFNLIVLQVVFLNAQSLVVTGDAIVYGDPTIEIISHLTVKNTTGQSLNVICEKNVISQPQGCSNYFCWGGSCYSSSTIISPDFTTIDGGQASTEFSGHFSTINGPTDASATVEYCFYPDTNPGDETCVTITFDGSGSTSSIIKTSAIVMSEFYPNPANEYTTINYNSAMNTHLNIIDILGNNVKVIHLSNVGSQKIYIGDLSKGLYFGNLMHNDKIIAIKKLIVK
jgi:hypothetical protein